MTHDEEAGDDLLAAIDLDTWRVPPPVAAHRPASLVRALTPAAVPRKRRLGWWIAGAVAFNAALIAILLVVLRSAEPAPVVTLPAGGKTTDAEVQALLRKLEAERAEMEAKLAEVNRLLTLIEELNKRIKEYEERDRMRTLPPNKQQPKQPDRQPSPDPVGPAPVVDPFSDRGGAKSNNATSGSCDEVSCVLQNYENGCCDKYRKDHPQPKRPVNQLPEGLDRTSISNGIASVKHVVSQCDDGSTAKGKVKVKVTVAPSGLVTNVIVESAPDAKLGACVAAAVQRAVFIKTQQGGSFSYPFVFTSP